MENCIFCNSFKEGDSLFDTENFFVKVGKGIICPGHVMIITKKHYKCMGDIDKKLVNEFLYLKLKLMKFITDNFFKPLVTENGVIMQSVFHAHTHFIPMKSEYYDEVDFYEGVVKTFLKNQNLEYKNIIDFMEILDIFKIDGEYLYFEQDNEIILFRTKKYSKIIQFIKDNLSYRAFFTKIGLKGVKDWKLMTTEDLKFDDLKIKKTREIFKNFSDFYYAN